MKAKKDVVLMSEQKRIRTGERVFREVEMFWAVVIVMVGLIVLFAEFPSALDARGELRTAAASPGQVRAAPPRETQHRPFEALIHLTSSEARE